MLLDLTQDRSDWLAVARGDPLMPPGGTLARRLLIGRVAPRLGRV